MLPALEGEQQGQGQAWNASSPSPMSQSQQDPNPGLLIKPETGGTAELAPVKPETGSDGHAAPSRRGKGNRLSSDAEVIDMTAASQEPADAPDAGVSGSDPIDLTGDVPGVEQHVKEEVGLIDLAMDLEMPSVMEIELSQRGSGRPGAGEGAEGEQCNSNMTAGPSCRAETCKDGMQQQAPSGLQLALPGCCSGGHMQQDGAGCCPAGPSVYDGHSKRLSPEAGGDMGTPGRLVPLHGEGGVGWQGSVPLGPMKDGQLQATIDALKQ